MQIHVTINQSYLGKSFNFSITKFHLHSKLLYFQKSMTGLRKNWVYLLKTIKFCCQLENGFSHGSYSQRWSLSHRVRSGEENVLRGVGLKSYFSDVSDALVSVGALSLGNLISVRTIWILNQGDFLESRISHPVHTASTTLPAAGTLYV